MERELAFTILGVLQPTKEEEIKEAYEKKLAQVQQDDIEGFIKIQEAYEVALEAIKEQVKNRAEILQREVELWIQKVHIVYKNLKMRMNVHSWKFLFQQDICKAEESKKACQEKLVEYLYEHHHVPHDVWEFIDETFEIVNQKEELYKVFEKEQLDFIIDQIQEKNPIPLKYFNGSEDLNYDLFITYYKKLVKQLDQKELIEAAETIALMDIMTIEHPYFELAKVRYELYRDNKEECCIRLRDLVEEYQTDVYVLAIAGEVYQACELKEKISEIYKKILEIDEYHFEANKIMQGIFLEEGAYQKAKDSCMRVLKANPYEESCLRNIKLINEKLIEEKRERVLNNQAIYTSDLVFEEFLELSRCYLENKEYILAIEQLIKVNDDRIKFEDAQRESTLKIEYHSLLSKLYYLNSQYHQGIKECEICGKLLLGEVAKSTKSELMDKKMNEYIYTNYEIQAKCYEALGNIQKGNYYNLALQSIQKAEEYATNKSSSLLLRATLLRKLNRYEEGLLICNRILEMEPNNFVGYVLRQEIYFDLGNSKGVLDDYHSARAIFKGEVKIYELAMEVYLNNNQNEEALQVYNLAKEQKLNSREFEILYLRYENTQVESLEQIEDFKEKAIALYHNLYYRNQYKKKALKILVELALTYRRVGLRTDALEIINIAPDISMDKDLLWWKSILLYEKEEYQDALTNFVAYKNKYNNKEQLNYYLAVCYRKVGDTSKAIIYYHKLYEEDENQEEAVCELFKYYYRQYEMDRSEEGYKLCMRFANKEVELLKTAEVYNDRASLYLLGGELALAQKDLEEAIKLDANHFLANKNLGVVYRCKGDYAQAISAFIKILHSDGDGNIKDVYDQLAQCYHLIKEPDKALSLYENYTKRYPRDIHGYTQLIYENCHLGNYHEAVELLRENIQPKSADYLSMYGHILILTEDYKKAIATYKKLVKESYEKHKVYKLMGDCYLLGMSNAEKAYSYYEMYYEGAKGNSNELLDAIISLAYCCYELNNQERIHKLVTEYNQVIQKQYGSIEKYMQSKDEGAIRLYNMGCIYLYQGNMDRAVLYFNRMTNENKCINCTLASCTCKSKGLAQTQEIRGNIQEVVQSYIGVLNHNPNDLFARRRVRELVKETNLR